MQYDEAVTEARQLVRRSEEDQWRLAQLTWEQVREGKTRAQWAQDIEVHKSYAADLYNVWDRYRDEAPVNRPTFAEAYRETRPSSGYGAAQERAVRNVRNLPPERRAKIAHDLLRDPVVRQATAAELREAYRRVPDEVKNASLGAPLEFADHVAGVREHAEAIRAMIENPRIEWSAYRASAAASLNGLAGYLSGLAELVEDPSRGEVTDEALERLLSGGLA